MNYLKVAIVFIAGITTIYACAYEFSFFNDTPQAIAIAIQFANGDNEPLYKLYIKSGTMKSFVPGTIDIPDIKWSFCLKAIYYIKNPTMQERAHNFALVKNWRKVDITWSDKPLKTAKHKKLLTQRRQKTNQPKIVKKKIPTDNKSLCRDRHFEIKEDEDGHISIIASLVESSGTYNPLSLYEIETRWDHAPADSRIIKPIPPF